MTLQLRYAHVYMFEGEEDVETGTFTVAGAPVRDVPGWLAALARMSRATREAHTPACVRGYMQELMDEDDVIFGRASKATRFARYDGSDAALAAVAALVKGLGEKDERDSACDVITTWWLTRTSLFFDTVT